MASSASEQLRNLFFPALTLLTALGWSLCLGASSLSVLDLFQFDFASLISRLSTPFVLLTLITLSAWMASLLIQIRKNDTIVTIMTGEVSLLIGAAIAAFLYPSVVAFWPVFVALLVAMPFILELAHIRYLELKKLVVLRVVSGGIRYAGLAIGIGLILMSYWIVESNPENKLVFREQFREQLLKQVQGKDPDGQALTDRLAQTNATLIAVSQQQTIEQIRQFNSYQKIAAKTGDPDAQTFKITIETYYQQVKDPAYVDRLAAETKKNIGRTPENVFAVLSEQNELFKWLEANLWILYAAVLFSLATLAANTLMAFTGLLAGYLFAVIQDHMDETNPPFSENEPFPPQ